MSGIVNKIKNWVNEAFNEEEGFYDEFEGATDYPVRDNLALEPAYEPKREIKVVQHPNARNGYEVKVIEPRTFEESLEIVNSLRDKKSIVLNLHLLDNEQSQRIVDFLSGATHAIDGHQQKIGDGVFLFTPCNVNISSETERTRAISDAFWKQPK